jgi:glycerophosphoryl diester phosphodiesterase
MFTVPLPRRSPEALGADNVLTVASGPTGPRFIGLGGPYLVAHRGGAGLARENTLAAFDRSFALGVRYLEADIRVTSDGECVAVHDSTLTRVTGADGRVSDLTLAGIRRLGIGGDRVLRVADLLKTFESARFVLDLKDPAALAPLIAVLQWHDAVDRVCLVGARDRWLLAARDLAGPQLSTGLGWESATRLVLAARSGRKPTALPPAEFAYLPRILAGRRVLTRRVVSVAHDLGLRVMAWNAEGTTAMHEMLDIGVDGLITDRPDLGRDVLLQRNLWRAPQAWPMPTPEAAPASARTRRSLVGQRRTRTQSGIQSGMQVERLGRM